MDQWISVKERLPDKQTNCLCYYGFEGSLNSGLRFTSVLTYYAYDENPHWQHEGTGLVVTHWMPLPKPPKEER